MSDEEPPNEEVLPIRLHSNEQSESELQKRPERIVIGPAIQRPHGRSSALRQIAAEWFAGAVRANRRRELINAELSVLLDIEDENEMLRELGDLLAQEDDRFAEDFARQCQSKIRWAESRNRVRRQGEAAAAEAQPETLSPRGLDSKPALIDVFERAFALSTDVGRVGRMELLLKATRRYSVQRARQLRRSTTD